VQCLNNEFTILCAVIPANPMKLSLGQARESGFIDPGFRVKHGMTKHVKALQGRYAGSGDRALIADRGEALRKPGDLLGPHEDRRSPSFPTKPHLP